MSEKNDLPITYVSKFIIDPDQILKRLISELNWERREGTPRSEYYCNDLNTPYVYGRGRGERLYNPQPYHPDILLIKEKLETYTNTKFEVCFLNLYHNQSDFLGFHSDNSPEMDDLRPIVTVSLGVEREIWFCPIGDKKNITKLKLENGSACIMAPGMQDTHLHRIPKASFQCGERISLTFRGYVVLNKG